MFETAATKKAAAKAKAAAAKKAAAAISVCTAANITVTLEESVLGNIYATDVDQRRIDIAKLFPKLTTRGLHVYAYAETDAHHFRYSVDIDGTGTIEEGGRPPPARCNAAPTVECAECVKVICMGLFCESEYGYLRSSWNILDMAIVISSIVSLILKDSNVG